MSQTFRHPEILEIARREGKVTVENLAERFGVTLQTIRRDLTDLAELGRLERVHGGAVLPSGTTNIAYEERRSLNHEGKAAIARACAARIPRDASIFLNIGTSTEAGQPQPRDDASGGTGWSVLPTPCRDQNGLRVAPMRSIATSKAGAEPEVCKPNRSPGSTLRLLG